MKQKSSVVKYVVTLNNMKLTPKQHLLLEELGTCIWRIQQEKKKIEQLCEKIDNEGLSFKEGSRYSQAKKIILNEL